MIKSEKYSTTLCTLSVSLSLVYAICLLSIITIIPSVVGGTIFSLPAYATAGGLAICLPALSFFALADHLEPLYGAHEALVYGKLAQGVVSLLFVLWVALPAILSAMTGMISVWAFMFYLLCLMERVIFTSIVLSLT